MTTAAMMEAFQVATGFAWGDPKNTEMEKLFASGWGLGRAQAATDIERDMLPGMGRQNRGVKLCLSILE